MTSDRFEGMDGQVKTVLMHIEDPISHRFRNPLLLSEALQFPGSIVRWNDSKKNTGLRVFGEYLISLTAAAAGGTQAQRANRSSWYQSPKLD